MKKKVIIVILLIIVIASISAIIYNNQDINLKKYDISKQEFYEFNYKNNNYAISGIYNINERDKIGIFLKKNKSYYLIEEINRCTYINTSFYVEENKIYFHCNFSPSNIIEYEVNGTNFQKKIYELKFHNTPNISQLHLQFDKVDDNYVYLYSVVKVDNSIEDGTKVKCSLKDSICNYDKGYIPYNKKVENSSKLIYEEISPNKEYIKNNEKYYIVRIYQNKNNVIVRVSSNSDFLDIQYDIKSNKTISKDNIKIQWTSNGYLYTIKEDEITEVAISIYDNDEEYSSRIIDFNDKSVYISSNKIIR